MGGLLGRRSRPYTRFVAGSILPQLIVGLLLLILLLLLAAAVGLTLLVLWGRRKYRQVRNHVAGQTVAGAWSYVQSRRSPWASHFTWDDVHGWTPQRARREMWRAVDAAESAVGVAAQGGASVAELPSLCRRIRAVSSDVDRILRVEPAPRSGASDTSDLRRQVADVIDAAIDVQRAAVAAASDANAAKVSALTRDAGDELDCVAAGLSPRRAPHRLARPLSAGARGPHRQRVPTAPGEPVGQSSRSEPRRSRAEASATSSAAERSGTGWLSRTSSSGSRPSSWRARMVSGSLRLSRANSPASVLTAHSHVPQPDRRVPRAAARAVTRSGSWCTTGLSQAPGGTRPPAPNSSGERPSTKAAVSSTNASAGPRRRRSLMGWCSWSRSSRFSDPVPLVSGSPPTTTTGQAGPTSGCALDP